MPTGISSQGDLLPKVAFPLSLPGGPLQIMAGRSKASYNAHRDFVAMLRHPQPPAAGCADKTKREPSSKLEVLFLFYLRWEGDFNVYFALFYGVI